MIRKACRADAMALLPMFTQLHALHAKGQPGIFAGGKSPYNAKFIRDYIEDKSSFVLIFEDRGEIEGFCAAKLYNACYETGVKCICIDDIFVKPAHRHKGIATALFAGIKKYAAENGYEKIDLCVWSFNKDALTFYEKQGMTEQRRYLEIDL